MPWAIVDKQPYCRSRARDSRIHGSRARNTSSCNPPVTVGTTWMDPMRRGPDRGMWDGTTRMSAAAITTAGLVTAHYTGDETVYWPFGALELVITAAVLRQSDP